MLTKMVKVVAVAVVAAASVAAAALAGRGLFDLDPEKFNIFEDEYFG
jgi:hypothetical protein